MNFKTIANFIKLVNNKVIININQATLPQNNIMNVNSDSIENPCFLKSKSYLKIVNLLYYVKTTDTLVTFFLVKKVLKNIYIFNNIILVSKSHIIKTISNFDSAVIWINI